MASQDREDPLSFGAWVQRQRKTLDLTQVDLAQKVGCAAVTIKKFEHDERRPSRQMAELLAQHLAIPHAVREDFLRMARGEFVSTAGDRTDALRIPPFLKEPTPQAQTRATRFVEREPELAHLETCLRLAMDGNGMPVFILGDPGSGKTTLATEFARRATGKHADLLVAGGQCNAQAGAGDPFRPFRDILATLTGDLEPARAAGGFQNVQAVRVWQAIPDTIKTVSTYGPDLVDLFIPVAPLIRRLAAYLSGPADWLDRFQALAYKEPSKRVIVEQYQILEEVTEVLKAISADYPLLLFLDDLQWVDDSSKNLLYHLGRRLAGSRILLVGACRSGENTPPHQPDPNETTEIHPIESVILELTRHFGDIQVNLNQGDASKGRAFVDAVIDREPNHLGPAFRQNLFQFTQGQPLFTVELLHSLQESGRLILDDEGKWIEYDSSISIVLPARIEALIEQRLLRLNESERNLLRVASVEGEVFTAEIAGNILGLDPKSVLQPLLRDLEFHHRMVQVQGEIRAGQKRFTRVQFRHALFQEYLYNQFSQEERQHLHRDIGEALAGGLFSDPSEQEGVVTDRLIKFGPVLIHHFWQGEAWDQVATYALKVGQQARQRYAMREAIANFELALNALDRQAGQASEGIYEAIMEWEEAAFQFRPYEEQLERLARAEAIARRNADKPRLIRALHWKANVLLSRGLWTQAGPSLTECLALADELKDEQLSVRPTYFKALMTTFSNPDEASGWIDRALDLSRKYHDQHIEAIALGTRGQVLAQLGDFSQSQKAIQAAREVSSRLGSPLTQSDVDLLAAWACLAMGNIDQAIELSRQSVERAIATDNMDCICNGLACQGYGNLESGKIAEAASIFEKGIERSDTSGAIIPKLNNQAGLAATQFLRGHAEAIEILAGVEADMVHYENLVGAANADLMLGSFLTQMGEIARAKKYLDLAIDFYRRVQMHPALTRAELALAELIEKSGRQSET